MWKWVMLILSMIPWIMAGGKARYYQFTNECKTNDWVVTQATLEWDNDKKLIVANITKNTGNGMLYRMHIIIDKCKNRTECDGIPKVWLDSIDCKVKNLMQNDIECCKAAKEASQLEKTVEWLTYRNGPLYGDELYKVKTCIDIEDVEGYVIFSNDKNSDFGSQSDMETSETNTTSEYISQTIQDFRRMSCLCGHLKVLRMSLGHP